MNSQYATPAEVLLVEDNEGDVRLTQEVLSSSRIVNTLHVARDGLEAQSFLCNKAPFESAPRPDIILLDLNLPKLDGRELLTWIRANEETKLVPVIVMTTSREEEDVVSSYTNHANCYIRKPIDLQSLVDVLGQIERFWLQIVLLPGHR